MAPIVAYFDYGSPYSYLAWHRVALFHERYASRPVRWVPVSAGHLFARDGTKPNAAYPNMLAYNKKDITRWAAAYGIPLVVPDSFPCNTISASRLHVAAEAKGPAAEEAYMAACFRAHWQHGEDLSDPQVLSRLAGTIALANWEAEASQHKQALIANTDAAYEAGAPGVPFFVMGEQAYWGNDRLDWLEAALAGRQYPAI